MSEHRIYEQRAQVFKALAHPSRLMIVDALQDGPKPVAELVRLIGAEYPTASRHIAVLREAGIVVEDRKQGNMVFYRLQVTCIAGFFSCVHKVIEQRR
ncbi:MAG: metalloregulator ArsR/SmtB family transcription factor [Candidatus Alcyoniella australis]|nr:metalloregulator ArsR/SmtB family transcription factor [Candidatus Alcyoniella australis]